MTIQNNKLVSNADILGALAQFPGIKEGGKNFDMVINAIVEGNNVLNVLHDPIAVAGIAPQQAHHFARFVEAHKDDLPTKLMPKKRDAIQILVADINFMKRDSDGWLVSTFKYNDPTRDNGFDFKSENHMSETFASEPVTLQVVRKLLKGEMVVEKRARLMHDIVTVKLNWVLEEGQSEPTEEQLAIQKELNDKGFKIMSNGETKYAKMIQQTNSQARQVMENFLVCDDEFQMVPDFFMKLGHNLIAYAKKNDDGTYTIDCTKYMTRIGLSGTSSVLSRTIQIGSGIQENDDQSCSVTGGNFEMRVQPDVHVKIRTGMYKVMNAQTHEFEVFDAADYPVDMIAGDGLILVNDRVYKALVAEHGVDVDAWQVRITPFGKGLAVFVPGLEKTFTEDIVAFQSAIKGDFREVVGTHKIQFRIALFNKSAKKIKKFTEYPYQFVHGTSLTAEDMMALVKPHVDRVMDMLADPEKLKEYLGMDHLDGASDDVLDKALVTTLMTFLHEAPFSYKDVQMKKYAVQHLMDMIKNWVVGSIPVEASYKFMVHDPLAIVEAIRLDRLFPGQLREDGDIVIPTNMGLSAGTVVVRDLKDEYIQGEIGMQRNPLIAKSESAFAMAVRDSKYVRAGHFRNLCIMSVHDFNTAKQGGADNDGDKTLVIKDATIIGAIKRNAHLPALLDVHVVEYVDGKPVFDSGCPKAWSNAPENVYVIPADMIEKQSGFKVTFTKDQYNDALINELHKLTKNYITRTLKPNQIGMLTNYATKLADAVRSLGYQYKMGVNAAGVALTSGDKAAIKVKIAQFEQWIDLLRLCQGWEIDSSKHGGAFWKELSNELSFLQNPPIEVGEVNPKTGKAVWFTPDWMAERKGKEYAKQTGSVLSRVFTDMVKERAVIMTSVEDMDKRSEGANIYGELNAAICMTPERYEMIRAHVVDIDKEYRMGMQSLIKKEAEANERAIAAASGNMQKLAYFMDMVTDKTKQDRQLLIESCAGQLERLEDVFTPEEIGFTAYKLTYIDSKSESTSFPWTVAKRQLLAACQVAAGSKPTRLPHVATRKADAEINIQLVNSRHADLIAKAQRNGFMDVKLVQDEFTGNLVYAVGVDNILLGYVYNKSAIWFSGADHARVAFTGGRYLSEKSAAIHAVEITLS